MNLCSVYTIYNIICTVQYWYSSPNKQDPKYYVTNGVNNWIVSARVGVRSRYKYKTFNTTRDGTIIINSTVALVTTIILYARALPPPEDDERVESQRHLWSVVRVSRLPITGVQHFP